MARITLLLCMLCAIVAAQSRCELESIHGTYVASDWGWIAVPQPGAPFPATLPAMLMGVASIGFDGKVTMSGAVNVAGQQTAFEAEGTVEVKSDCIGTLRARVTLKASNQAGEEVIFRIVVLPAQKEILSFHMNPGDMGLGTWKRMSAVPDSAKW